MRSMTNSSVCENWNMASVPEKTYDIVAAVTDEMSRGKTDVIVKSSMSTSMTKTSPAIGALKIPATAPAAPQPTSSMSVFCSMRKSRPRFDPMAAPVSTMGASAPTDPPNPIVSELATSELHMLCGLMRLLRCEMA